MSEFQGRSPSTWFGIGQPGFSALRTFTRRRRADGAVEKVPLLTRDLGEAFLKGEKAMRWLNKGWFYSGLQPERDQALEPARGQGVLDLFRPEPLY